MVTPADEITEDKLPRPKDVAKTYAEVAQRASRLITEHVQREIERGISTPSDELGIAQAFMDMTVRLLANPYKVAQAQMNLVWDYFAMWQHSMLRFMGMNDEPAATPAEGDKRFKDEQWEDHFLFDFIKQSYLISARHIHDVVSSVEGLDDTTSKRVNFFTRQYIDALSPSNFAFTNPEVFRETVRTQGQNLINGFDNLLRDIEEGGGNLRIRMTDTSAFEMGRNIATTPGKVIYQNELMQLLQFAPSTEQVFKRPVLILPPWINKYYIMDLRENNSLIKWLVDQQHTVFVISWVNPDEKLAQAGFDDYLVKGALTAVDKVCEQTGADHINGVGYCIGGTLLASCLSYMAARKDNRLASGTFLATMLDFSQPGELGVFIDEKAVAGLEKRMAERGFLDGSEMASTFNMLRANDLIWSFVVNNYLLGKDPFPFDLLFWNSDSTRMPAKMHSFYLRNFYMKNLLREPGGIELAGVPIDLRQVRVPSYFVGAVEDHIAPWKSTYLGARLFSGPTRFVLGGSGHIAGIVNPPSANKYGYWVNASAKLADSADEWFAGAKHNPGSWWTDWQKWLKRRNGSERIAARDPNKGKLKLIEDAPGSYASMRLDTPKRP